MCTCLALPCSVRVFERERRFRLRCAHLDLVQSYTIVFPPTIRLFWQVVTSSVVHEVIDVSELDYFWFLANVKFPERKR
jgi:hypothetical protein